MNLRRFQAFLLCFCVLSFALFSSLSCVTVQAAQNVEEDFQAPVGIYNGVSVPVQFSNTSLLSDFDTEGYTVSGYYWIDGTQYPFEGDTYFVYPNSSTVQVDYLIYLPEDISRGESFDVSLRLAHSPADCEYIGVTLYDSNWQANGIWSASHFNPIFPTRTDIGLNGLVNETHSTHCFKVMVKFKNVTTNGNFTCYPNEIHFTSVSSNGLLNNIISAIGTIISTLLSLPDLIFEAFANFFDYLMECLHAIYDSMNNWLGSIVQKFDDLTNSIRDYLYGVRDSLLNGIYFLSDQIKAKLQFVLDSLLDGIYNFFVPTEEQIDELYGRIDELSLGFIGESFSIIYDIVLSAFDSADLELIEFPLIELDFSGVKWNFGGWQVPIIPEGFDDLIWAVKIVTDCIFTLSFINLCRRKFDSILEG